MICPYSRNGATTVGVSCSKQCAHWDKKNEQCIEHTKAQWLASIANVLLDFAHPDFASTIEGSFDGGEDGDEDVEH